MSRLYTKKESDTRLVEVKVVMEVYGWGHGCGAGGGCTVVEEAGTRL